MAQETDELPGESGRREEIERAIWSHVTPFVAWIFFIKMLGDPAGWKYAVLSVTGLALFLALRPWRWYSAPRSRHLPIALLAGAVVFILWILPESRWAGRLPLLQSVYLKWAVFPLGRVPEPSAATPFAPAVCGWPLAVVRVAGSALVIAVIEEFFWRGFIYRWLTSKDFLKADPGNVTAFAFITTCLLFGVEHHRWFAGILAGIVYGWMYVRTRDLWATAIAHALTNLLLGIYVIATGSYAFW